MSERAIKCPNCHETFNLDANLQSKFRRVTKKDDTPFVTDYRTWAALAQCPGCGFCVVVYVQDYSHDEELSSHNKIVRWFPPTVPQIDTRLPEAYRKDLTEAAVCLGVKAPNACVAMCRRVISRLAIDRGADASWTTGQQLKHLKEKALIEEKLLRAATAVKAFGDQGAHPPKEVSIQEAEQSFSITESILDYALLLDQKLRFIATDSENKLGK